MKKFFIAIAALLVAATSFAQNKTGVSIAVGYELEPYNYGGREVNPKILNGVFARADYVYTFAKHSGVSAGLRFDYVGLGDYAQLQYEKTTWKKAYLDIPIKYNLHFGGFFLNAGPVVKFLLSYKYTTTNTVTSASETFDALKLAPDAFNKVYFGVGAGLGYVFKDGIKLFINYDYNFTNVVKDKQVYPVSKPSLISFGVGYNF